MGNKAHGYAGKVFKAPSGQWGFKFYENGVELGGGAGIGSEAEAVEECDAILCGYEDGVLDERLARIETVKYEDLPPLASLSEG